MIRAEQASRLALEGEGSLPDGFEFRTLAAQCVLPQCGLLGGTLTIVQHLAAGPPSASAAPGPVLTVPGAVRTVHCCRGLTLAFQGRATRCPWLTSGGISYTGLFYYAAWRPLCSRGCAGCCVLWMLTSLYFLLSWGVLGIMLEHAEVYLS